MDCQKLITQLGYRDNPAFLQGDRLVENPGCSFFFSQAKKMEKGAIFHGVYSLADDLESEISSSTITPVVYVFEANNENIASQIHKKVWCQNTVPYVIVTTPKNVRLYSGFEYDKNKSDVEQALAIVEDANDILDKLSAFTANEIDSGNIWKSQEVSTEKRVDYHLLANLKKLSEVLTGDGYKLSIEDSHTLIGKYIYLKYLRDRDILSYMRLEEAGVSQENIYSRMAQKEKLYDLEKYLDVFLNGSVFPLPTKSRIRAKHVQKVAGAFKGDDPEGGQQVLFDLYDFSYVPIETLSVVYQQFLHQKGEGRSKGAYYTPVHLVNFILDELDAKRPLCEGMKVFDPSCGSGAFLVQCYRRLIERVMRKKGTLKPTELRGLLVDHIFGLDADEEACRVAELSLSLTLLDYIEPRDLRTYPTFKLPDLHNKNIFHCEKGFFDENSLWEKSISQGTKYDWVVGNPPWKDDYDDEKPCDCKALEWIKNNKQNCPVGKEQLAEAFAWKVHSLVSNEGQCGLLMPALTLFKKLGNKFRSKFFSIVKVWCVINFSNLRHCLFEGAVNPAAAFFFSGEKKWDNTGHYITTYAPFAYEQLSQQKPNQKTKKLWFFCVNSSAVKEIPLKEIVSGDAMLWKMAMWGGWRDERTVRTLTKRYSSLERFADQNSLSLTQGLALRYEIHENDEVDLANELQGVDVLDMESLKRCYGIHQFTKDNFFKLPNNKNIYTRKGRKDLPLSICCPPHIFIDAARRFVVYSDKYFIIPPRQIGISGNQSQEPLLKALALYLKSDFVRYQQWLTCAALGVERDRPNLDDLKKIPIPLHTTTKDELVDWAELHDNIVEAEKNKRDFQDNPLFNPHTASSQSLELLLKKLNKKVNNLLGVKHKQRWLIEDLLAIRMKLNEGRIAKEAISPATKKEMTDFARIFKNELDLFLDHTGERKVHKISVFYTDESTVLIVDHLKKSTTAMPKVAEVCDNKTRLKFDSLQRKLTGQKSQWLYFTRCMKVYEGRKTYIFKPRQRLYWLKSQALAEADEFIEGKIRTE